MKVSGCMIENAVLVPPCAVPVKVDAAWDALIFTVVAEPAFPPPLPEVALYKAPGAVPVIAPFVIVPAGV